MRPSRLLAALAVTLSMLVGLAALPAWAVSLDMDTSFAGDGIRRLALERGTVLSMGLDGAQVLAAGRYVDEEGSPRVFVTRLRDNGSIVEAFGQDGIASRRAPGVKDGVDMQVLSDGSVLTAYARPTGVVVNKWTPDGKRDSSFSADGERLIAMPITGRLAVDALVTVDTRGRVVVAAMEAVEKGYNAVITRLSSIGAYDTSFSKNGRVTVNLGKWDWVDALATDADDRIVLGSDYWRPEGKDVPEYGVVVRLRANGELDTSFSGDGVVRFKMLDDGVNYPVEIGVGASGRLTVAAVAGGEAYGAIRLTPTGRFVRDYGHDGVLSVNCVCSLYVASVVRGQVAFSGSKGFVPSEGDIDWTTIAVRISKDGARVDRNHFDLLPDVERDFVSAVLIDGARTVLGGRGGGNSFVARLG